MKMNGEGASHIAICLLDWEQSKGIISTKILDGVESVRIESGLTLGMNHRGYLSTFSSITLGEIRGDFLSARLNHPGGWDLSVPISDQDGYGYSYLLVAGTNILTTLETECFDASVLQKVHTKFGYVVLAKAHREFDASMTVRGLCPFTGNTQSIKFVSEYYGPRIEFL